MMMILQNYAPRTFKKKKKHRPLLISESYCETKFVSRPYEGRVQMLCGSRAADTFLLQAYYQISNPKHYIVTNMSREKSQQLLRHIQLNREPYCHNKFANNHYKEQYD